MKRNLFYLLPLLLIALEACSPKNSDPIPLPNIMGTYKGKFKLAVKNAQGAFDTVKKDSALFFRLSSPNSFAVTGDTATIHAGSRGLFQYDNNFIAFLDSTYKAGPQPKFHLVGTYQYGVNSTGTILVMQRNNAVQDSILRYEFTKISN